LLKKLFAITVSLITMTGKAEVGFVRVYCKKDNFEMKKLMLQEDVSLKIPALFDSSRKTFFIATDYFNFLQENAKKFINNSSAVKLFASFAHKIECLASKNPVAPYNDLYFMEIQKLIKIKSFDFDELFVYLNNGFVLPEDKRQKILSQLVKEFCGDYDYTIEKLMEKFNSYNLLSLREDFLTKIHYVENLRDLRVCATLVLDYLERISVAFKQNSQEVSADHIIALTSLSLLCSKNKEVLLFGKSLINFLETETRIKDILSSKQIWALTQIAAATQNINMKV
jgi:hypothetical protein